MKKHVIALGRQFGSGGREIGRKLSESLGFAYYDRELLKLAAERAEVGEELFADKDEKAGNPWLFKAFYQGRPWGLPENYDICINSARLGIERTAALLAEHCRELFSNPC